MEFGHDDGGEDAVTKAVRAAFAAKSAQKRAEKVAKEALEVARRELKRKSKVIEEWKNVQHKKTMKSYFQSSRGSGVGQPLSLVFDRCMPEVPEVEPNSQDDYPSNNDINLVSRSRSVSLSQETGQTSGSSSGSGDTVVLSVKSPLITIFEESEELDDSKFVEVPIKLEGSKSDDSNFESPPLKKGDGSRCKSTNSQSKAQMRYDHHQKFQIVWASKLPWAKGVMALDRVLHMVKCKVCSAVDKKPCIMAPKSDTLFKHDGKRTAKKDLPQFKVKAGEQYIATQCKHRRNMRLYAVKGPASVLNQINQCTTLESKKKRVQFTTLFQLLSDGQPLLEFESRLALYKFLGAPDLPVAHWCDSSSWALAGYMYKQIVEETKRWIKAARFIAITVDEVIAVDNNSYLSVHAYVVKDWVRIPLLVSLQWVECSPYVDNLIEMIVSTINSGGDLDSESFAKKVLSFRADGASTLQGARFGITQQVKDKHALFLIGVHYVAHHCNLTFKALSNLKIFSNIEKLLTVTYSYFSKSPKRYSEFKQLVELTETKGLKMLRNV